MSNNKDMESIVARHSKPAKAKPTEAVNTETVGTESVTNAETVNKDAEAMTGASNDSGNDGGKIRRKSAEQRKERRVSWNISPVLYKELKETAADAELSISAFVSMAVKKAIKEHKLNSN